MGQSKGRREREVAMMNVGTTSLPPYREKDDAVGDVPQMKAGAGRNQAGRSILTVRVTNVEE